MDRNIIQETAHIEALQLMKEFMQKYPTDKDDSCAIILCTLENVAALVILSLENNVRGKDIMRSFSKNVLLKMRYVKENLEADNKSADSKN